MKVLYSGFIFPHHSSIGGYDKIASCRNDFVCGNLLPFANGICKSKILSFLNFIIVELITLARIRSYDCVHYIYPESTVFFSPIIARFLKKKVVYTLHLDESFWSNKKFIISWLRLSCIAKADLVICLSTAHAEIIKLKFPYLNVQFIPHGIDFDSASNFLESKSNVSYVSIVGDNYRDYRAIEFIINKLTGTNYIVNLVGVNLGKINFRPADNIICQPRIADNVYYDLVAKSQLLVLPLTFATANNALLESLALGTLVICSKIPGVKDYIVDDDFLFEDDSECIEKINYYCNLSESEYAKILNRICNKSRELYSWNIIRHKIANILKEN